MPNPHPGRCPQCGLVDRCCPHCDDTPRTITEIIMHDHRDPSYELLTPSEEREYDALMVRVYVCPACNGNGQCGQHRTELVHWLRYGTCRPRS